MKPGSSVQVHAAAQLYVPIIALFAFLLLADQPPGVGAGFVSGLAFALALCLHTLVYGVRAAKRALPPAVAKLVLAAGVVSAVAGASASRWPHAQQLTEGGLFLATAAAAALIVVVVFGRAPTLRDADW